jgi:hypothetical protein
MGRNQEDAAGINLEIHSVQDDRLVANMQLTKVLYGYATMRCFVALEGLGKLLQDHISSKLVNDSCASTRKGK